MRHILQRIRHLTLPMPCDQLHLRLEFPQSLTLQRNPILFFLLFRPRYLANIQSLVAKEELIDAQSRLNGLQIKMGQMLEEKVEEEEAQRVHRCPAAALEAVSGARTCESVQTRAQISCSPPK